MRNKHTLRNRILSFALATSVVFGSASTAFAAKSSPSNSAIRPGSSSGSYNTATTYSTSNQNVRFFAIPILSITTVDSLSTSDTTVNSTNKIISLKNNFSPLSFNDNEGIVVVAPYLQKDIKAFQNKSDKYNATSGCVDMVTRHLLSQNANSAYAVKKGTDTYGGKSVGNIFKTNRSYCHTEDARYYADNQTCAMTGYANVDEIAKYGTAFETTQYENLGVDTYLYTTSTKTADVKAINGILSDSVLKDGVDNYNAIMDKLSSSTGSGSLYNFFKDFNLIESPCLHGAKDSGTFVLRNLGWCAPKYTNSDVVNFSDYISYKTETMFNATKYFHKEYESLDQKYKDEADDLFEAVDLDTEGKDVIITIGYIYVNTYATYVDGNGFITDSDVTTTVIPSWQADNIIHGTSLPKASTDNKSLSAYGYNSLGNYATAYNYIVSAGYKSYHDDAYVFIENDYKFCSGYNALANTKTKKIDTYLNLHNELSGTDYKWGYYTEKLRTGEGTKGDSDYYGYFEPYGFYDDMIYRGNKFWGAVDVYWNGANTTKTKEATPKWCLDSDDTTRMAQIGMLMAVTQSGGTPTSSVAGQHIISVDAKDADYAKYMDKNKITNNKTDIGNSNTDSKLKYNDYPSSLITEKDGKWYDVSTIGNKAIKEEDFYKTEYNTTNIVKALTNGKYELGLDIITSDYVEVKTGQPLNTYADQINNRSISWIFTGEAVKGGTVVNGTELAIGSTLQFNDYPVTNPTKPDKFNYSLADGLQVKYYNKTGKAGYPFDIDAKTEKAIKSNDSAHSALMRTYGYANIIASKGKTGTVALYGDGTYVMIPQANKLTDASGILDASLSSTFRFYGTPNNLVFNKDKTDKTKVVPTIANEEASKRVNTNVQIWVKYPEVESRLYEVTIQASQPDSNGVRKMTVTKPEELDKKKYSSKESQEFTLPEETSAVVMIPLSEFNVNNMPTVGKSNITKIVNDLANELTKGKSESLIKTGLSGKETVVVGSSTKVSGGYAIIAIKLPNKVELDATAPLYSWQMNQIYPDMTMIAAGMPFAVTTNSNLKQLVEIKPYKFDCYKLKSDSVTKYKATYHSATNTTAAYYTCTTSNGTQPFNNREKAHTHDAYENFKYSTNLTIKQTITGDRTSTDDYLYTKGFYNASTKMYYGGNFNYAGSTNGANFNTKQQGLLDASTKAPKSGDNTRYDIGIMSYVINVTRKDFGDKKVVSSITANGGTDPNYVADVIKFSGNSTAGNKPNGGASVSSKNDPTALINKTRKTTIVWSGTLDNNAVDGTAKMAVGEVDSCDLTGSKYQTTEAHTGYYNYKYSTTHYSTASAAQSRGSYTYYTLKSALHTLASNPTDDTKYIYKYEKVGGYNYGKARVTGGYKSLMDNTIGCAVDTYTLNITELAFKYAPSATSTAVASSKTDEIVHNALGDTNANASIIVRDAKVGNIELKYYPEVQMRYFINTNSNKKLLSSASDVKHGTVKVMGEELRKSNPSGLYIYAVNTGLNDANKTSDTKINDFTDVDKTVSGVTISSGYQTTKDSSTDLPILYAGSDITLNVENNYTINMYGYVLDVINKSENDGKTTATSSGVEKGKLASASDTKALSDVSYKNTIADESNVYTDWGNSGSTSGLFDEYKTWTEKMLDTDKYHVNVELQIKQGSTEVGKYDDFHSTFSKFAVVKDGKITSTGFSKDSNNHADGVFALKVEKGELVKYVVNNGKEYYDSAYLALLYQIADDANVSLTEAEKIFDNSDLYNSIKRTIQSSKSDSNNSSLTRYVDNTDTIIYDETGLDKNEHQLGDDTNWYDEKVKTIVVRRYYTDSVSPSGVSLNDKVDYDVTSESKKTYTASWKYAFTFDVTDSILDGATNNTGKNIVDKKLTIVDKQYVAGADFAIKTTSEDADH